jgi:hypothetical protein
VSDSAGQRTLATVEAVEGTAIVAGSNLAVAPSTVTLDSCTAVANAVVAGGQGANNYQPPVTSNSSVIATLQGTILTIRRAAAPSAVSPVTVAISDGRSNATLTVDLVGAALGACP